MGKYTKIEFNVPDVNRVYVGGGVNYSLPNTLTQNKALLQKTYSDYKEYITRWGSEFEIDDSIISSFIVTESGGKNVAPNQYKATGLMQLTPDTCWEVLAKWKQIVGSNLSANATVFFNKAIPSSKTYNPNKLPTSAVESEILFALQNNPEFNIAIGCACIRWLLEALKENGKAEINKVMVSYNSGYYATKNKVKGTWTTAELVNNKNLPLESRSYLLKMLGVNGYIDLWFKK